MNNMSWFLYLVDILGNLAMGLGLLTIAVIALLIIHLFEIGEGPLKREEQRAAFKRTFRAGLLVILALSLLQIVIPNTRTMYLILGSEVGEEVVNSETAQRVQKAINKKLDEYLSVED